MVVEAMMIKANKEREKAEKARERENFRKSHRDFNPKAS